MAEFTIDPEFRDWLPKQSDEERTKLLAQINADGCRDPLVVWAEESILIDGHHRYAICIDLGLPYTVVTKSFKSRNDVMLWMFNNQDGRRNWNAFQRGEMALKLKPVLEAQAKERQARKPVKSVPEILPEQKQPDTRDVVGKMAGVSGKTIDKVEKILAAAPAEVIEQVRNKEKSIEAAYREVVVKPTATVTQEAAQTIQPLGVGVERAHEAIARLKKIPKDDALRKRAFQIVRDWMKQNP